MDEKNKGKIEPAHIVDSCQTQENFGSSASQNWDEKFRKNVAKDSSMGNFSSEVHLQLNSAGDLKLGWHGKNTNWVQPWVSNDRQTSGEKIEFLIFRETATENQISKQQSSRIQERPVNTFGRLLRARKALASGGSSATVRIGTIGVSWARAGRFGPKFQTNVLVSTMQGTWRAKRVSSARVCFEQVHANRAADSFFSQNVQIIIASPGKWCGLFVHHFPGLAGFSARFGAELRLPENAAAVDAESENSGLHNC